MNFDHVQRYDARTLEGYAAIRAALTPPFAGAPVIFSGLGDRQSALIALSRLHSVVQVDRAATTGNRAICWPMTVGGWSFCQQRFDRQRNRLRPVYRWNWL